MLQSIPVMDETINYRLWEHNYPEDHVVPLISSLGIKFFLPDTCKQLHKANK